MTLTGETKDYLLVVIYLKFIVCHSLLCYIFLMLLLLLLSHFSRVRLCVTPWIVALQAPLSMGILQARILEWVAISVSIQALVLQFIHRKTNK